jgi:hypothetical protein
MTGMMSGADSASCVVLCVGRGGALLSAGLDGGSFSRLSCWHQSCASAVWVSMAVEMLVRVGEVSSDSVRAIHDSCGRCLRWLTCLL